MSKSLLLAPDAACTEFQARALLSASRELLAIVSPSGEFLFVNANFSRVLGYAPHELIGKSFLCLHAGSDVDRIQQKFASIVTSGNDDRVACRCSLRAKSGQLRWFDAVASNRIADPDVLGILISYQDVTEIQRMEAQRLVLSNIVHALNETSNLDALLFQIHDALKKVVYAENCFVALYDPQTEMFHFPFFVDQFDPPPPPQKVARTCMAYVFRTGNSCSIPQSEFDHLASRGEVELVGSASPAWLGVPLKTPSATIGVMVVQHYQNENAYDQRDLEFLDSVGGHIALAIERVRAEEALRKSESMFRLLFSHTPLPMWVFDVESLRFLQVNEAATTQYGFSESEFRRMTFSDIRPDGNEASFAKHVEEWKQEGRHHGHWRHKRKDGKSFEVDVVSHKLEYGGRSVRLVVAQDVSERQLLEQQLRQAQKMEAVGRLAGGVAHDFNNLLMVIKGHTELLLDVLPVADHVTRKIEQIDRSADRATALTRQLLAFSRMQVLQPRPMNLNSVVDEMGKLLPRLIGEDIELIVRVSSNLGTIRADASQMEQIIMNLAVNARDAMPNGGKLIIETQNIELDHYYREAHPIVQAGRYVLLSVSDNGTGMDAETQAHIFEPFFTTKEQGKGTGLGLATVYGVVKQSGGFVWVYSELGKGTTFKIYLPRVDEAAAIVGASTPTQVLRGTETVLLTEDEQDVREVAREFLESAGYKVLQAPSGEAALKLAAAHDGAIDLLVTDMVMPGMNGQELARRMRIARGDLRVLYMSGYSEHAAEEATRTEGSAVLAKPFSRSALLRTAREVLQK
ncbi:MAG TPA: PAS domain S-box protein [Candidatus Acidoferrum sp.]|nr:PAS domain S-box protein [Candidatus Acidoferrum sp.]